MSDHIPDEPASATEPVPAAPLTRAEIRRRDSQRELDEPVSDVHAPGETLPDSVLQEESVQEEPFHDDPFHAIVSDAPGRKPTRRTGRGRTVVPLLLMLALFGAVVAAGVYFVPKIFASTSTPAEDFPGPGSGSVTVEVLSGQSGGDIGATLVSAGVVASRAAFVSAFNANPGATGIHPGVYNLMSGMRAADAVAGLLNPANRAELKLTVVEGFTASQIYERIASVTGIPLADVQAAAADTAALGLPAEAGGNIEGWLAAETYTIEKDATASDILAQMVARTVAILDERGVPVEQRQEALIKASIAVKEVSSVDEYGKVVRVIDNRLLPGSPTNGTLGMDTVLAYGLGKSAMNLTKSDVESDNPFNTRIHPGLPPTPIASPGTAAIDAALNPPEGDWLYFVTVNLDTGETRFTANYDEQQANVALFKEWLAAQTASPSPAG